MTLPVNKPTQWPLRRVLNVVALALVLTAASFGAWVLCVPIILASPTATVLGGCFGFFVNSVFVSFLHEWLIERPQKEQIDFERQKLDRKF